MGINVPYFWCDNEVLNRASRIATGDIAGNCIPFKDGLLKEEKLCVMAGLDYDTPWTRDTAINTMNSLCISDGEFALNTLMSVCEEKDGKTYIGGQYWDAIIWATGLWQCSNRETREALGRNFCPWYIRLLEICSLPKYTIR